MRGKCSRCHARGSARRSRADQPLGHDSGNPAPRQARARGHRQGSLKLGVTPPGSVPAAATTPTETTNRVTHFSLLDAGVSTPRERRNLSMRDRVWQWLHRRRDTDWCKTVTRRTRAKLTIKVPAPAIHTIVGAIAACMRLARTHD